jgi:hypothetical protein
MKRCSRALQQPLPKPYRVRCVISSLRAEPIQDIRGQRFEQTCLPTDLQGAIAGQKPLNKGLVVIVLGLSCLAASTLISVLGSTLGLELQSLGRFGGTFYESLTTTVILILWLPTIAGTCHCGSG